MNKSTLAICLAIGAAYLLAVGSLALEIKETKFPCERLPSHVRPYDYQLELEFPSFDEETYRGQVNISLEFLRKDDYKYEQLLKGLAGDTCKVKSLGSNTIVLHADPRVEIEDIEVITESCGLKCFGGPMDKKRTIRSVKRDSAKQLIAIELWKGVHAGGRGLLNIKFAGKLREDKRGVYLSEFFGQKYYQHLVSQFQPTDARTVFPVFDEPRFKANFQVSIVHPRGLTALSNEPVESTEDFVGTATQPTLELTRTNFRVTQVMSVHMVAFTVGQFDAPLEKEMTSKIGGKKYKVRVFTEPGRRESGHFALEVAWRSLEHFEQFINYEYPLDKFDIVAIADHDQDNTEHWGLAFIRDPLVWVDNQTKPDSRISIAVNVAHVCVHQWFANLVTVAWWNDLWITEGVASSFAFKIVRELYPQFESEYFVRLATLSRVLQKDAPGNWSVLKPELDDLRTSEHVYAVFNDIGFMKSAALATMIDRALDKVDANWYRTVLRTLVFEFKYGIVNSDDYLSIVKTTLNIDLERGDGIEGKLAKIIDNFGSLQGVPLLDVRRQDNELLINWQLMHSARSGVFDQESWEPFQVQVYDDILIIHDQSPWTQYVPIPIRETRAWIDDDVEYVKVSSRPDIHTYYRVRYSPNLYSALCEPISSRKLAAMDRLHVLDDANVLAQAHLISGDTFKQLVDCFADEDNGAVLIELMVALKTLSSLQLSSPSSKAIENIFEKYGFAVTGEETFLEQRSRSIGLKALITQGNQQVIEAALKTFEEGQVALFLREPVYTAVVLHGTEAQVEQLLTKLDTEDSYEEKLRLASALSLTKDSVVLEKLWLWLHWRNGLKEEVIEPLRVTIRPKLWPKQFNQESSK